MIIETKSLPIYIGTFILYVWLGSCSFSKKIKDGESAFERKQYAVAVDMLLDEYEKSNNDVYRGRKSYLLGVSFLKLQEYNLSYEWLDKAVKHKYGVEALGYLANVSKILENYPAAIEQYQRLIQDTGRKQEFEREILLCRQALRNKQEKSLYSVEKVNENSNYSDYSPVFYEENFLVFTSERDDATGKNTYNWTGQKFSDIFVMQKYGSEVKRFDSSINTQQNEGTPWFSRDMNNLYFTRCYSFGNGDEKCKIMSSKRINDFWEEPKVLPFVDDKFMYGQPTLVENDSILVFVSDIESPGGTSDLYYSELGEDGRWSVPEKLPSSINTQGNEKFPTGDGDTLYFSSDYLPGFGGYDIFKTYLKQDYTWAPPENLGYGINSGGDEFSFILDYKARSKSGVVQQGYFTTSKPGSGKDDIMRFSKRIPIISTPIDTILTQVDAPLAKSIFVTVKTYTQQYSIDDDPNSSLSSLILLPSTSIRMSDENNIRLAEGYTDNNAFYFTAVPQDKIIKIIGAKLNYLSASAIVDTRNIEFKDNETSKTINIDLVLDKIYLDKEINLKNIYYDFDKWDIKDEAIPTLNNLVIVLNDNPRIKIQLSSHTDCRGLDDYNQILSQKRAQSVVDYLISKGISSDRLIAQGYGESQLIDSCICEICTEDQHQTNRRTTFKIIELK